MRVRKPAAAAVTAVLAATGAAVSAGASPAMASTLTCARQPSIVQAAPTTGGAAVTVAATPAGAYQVNQPAAGSLAVSGTPTANSGWTANVPIASGARVRVVYHSTTSAALDRYTSSLNSTFTKLITHVVFCS